MNFFLPVDLRIKSYAWVVNLPNIKYIYLHIPPSIERLCEANFHPKVRKKAIELFKHVDFTSPPQEYQILYLHLEIACISCASDIICFPSVEGII